MAKSNLTLAEETVVYDSMLSTGTLYMNKINTECSISLSQRQLEIDPNRQTAYNFLSKYDGKTFAGRLVTVKKHTIQATGEIVDAISLSEAPEWLSLIS